MARYFYSLDDRTRIGPVTIETLRALLVSGTLKPEHFVFIEGASAWVEAREVPGLLAPAPSDDTTKNSPAPRRAPSGLRRINTSEYASVPPLRGMAVARGLYGPPEPCPMRYRVAAACTDAAVLALLLAIVLPIAHAIAHRLGADPHTPSLSITINALGVVVTSWLYHAGLEASPWQGTLGKRALTIRVVDRAHRRLTLRRATARYFAKSLSVLPLGLGLAAAWLDPKFRALHDRLAGTLVERTPPV